MRLSIIGFVILGIAGAGLATSASLARSDNAANVGGDIDYGRYLSSECLTCHQATGADKGIPSITGWEEEAFIAVLKAYQDKELPNPVMQNVAASLDDEQIEALAVFFAALPPPN